MKRRGDSSWLLWGLLAVAVLAFVWYSGGMRERFSSVPLLTGNSSADKPILDKLNQIATSLGYNAGSAMDASKVVYDYGSTYTSATSVPTKDQFVSQVSNGKLTSYSQLTGSDKSEADIAYQYFYGSSSTPAPAASSSTQPMTVGIPTPCRPQYKSIPGGSMEFKCFS